LIWKLECNGEPVMDGEISPELFAATLPGESCTIILDEFRLEALRLEDVRQERGECEYTIIFSFLQKNWTVWSDPGFEQAFSQIVFSLATKNTPAPLLTTGNTLKTKREDERQFIKGDGYEYIFEHGVLISLLANGVELLKKPVTPNLWRAPTDNDYGFGNFFGPAKKFMNAARWMKASTHQIPQFWHKRDVPNGIEIVSEWKHPLCHNLQTVYTVYPDGKLSIELIVHPKRIDLIRAGLQIILTEDFNKITWYGRGPHECYPDRKKGARITKHTTDVKDIEHRYVRPQENGARCDVRWLSVSSDKKKINIKDLSGEGLIFSAWHYEQEDLASASHDHLLIRKPLTTLNIDSTMCGVGGDLPGIAALHKEYTLPGNKEYKLKINIELI